MIQNKLIATLCVLLSFCCGVSANDMRDEYVLSLYGNAKYPGDFQHFDYVNPQASKGGAINLGAYGTYDSFNPYVILGSPASFISNLIYGSLMGASQDEVESLYPAIAESYQLSPRHDFITFKIHEKAVFSDGKPITCADIVWSFEALQSHPNYKRFLQEMKSVECLSSTQPRYHFANLENRELPLIAASLPVLPKHFWAGREFDSDLLRVPVSSGPYVIGAFKPGNHLTYERLKNWWAKDLPFYKGRFNFDKIKYIYFRNMDAMFESFKSGEIDYRMENVAQKWVENYNFPAIQNQEVIRKKIKNHNPQPMQASIFNLRHPYFQNINIRKAFNYCNNFDWLNEVFFYNSYTRTTSFFQNTALQAKTLPNDAQMKILAPYRAHLPPGVLDSVFDPPNGNADGFIRDQMLEALSLFEKGGWHMENGRMLDANNVPVTIEYLYYDKSTDRIILPLVEKLKLVGIEMKLRLVDTNQYLNRLENFDFEMTGFAFPSTHTPGYEQFIYWGSQAASQKGSMNLSGVKNPAIDAIITKMLSAATYQELIDLGQSLDRILQFSWLCIPQWHLGSHRLVYWNRFGAPKLRPKYDVGFIDTWWIDAKKDTKLHHVIERGD